MKNLAVPAPEVEPAVAESIKSVEPAVAARASQTEPPGVKSPDPVEPAVAGSEFSQKSYNEALAGNNNVQQLENPLSVKALRGESGSDFEGYAAVLRGAPEKNCLKKYLPCIYDERDYVTYGEVKKYVLVKGSSCFVYAEQTDPSPLYAIPLQDDDDENELIPIQEDPDHLDPCSVTINPRPGDHKPKDGYVTVLLKYRRKKKRRGDSGKMKQAYQFTFNQNGGDKGVAKRFIDVVERNAKRGGHAKPHPATVAGSVLRANQVAKEAKKYQPEI